MSDPPSSVSSGSIDLEALRALAEKWRNEEFVDSSERGYVEAAVQLQVCANELDAVLASLHAGAEPMTPDLRALAGKWRSEFATPYANRCGDLTLSQCAAELEAALASRGDTYRVGENQIDVSDPHLVTLATVTGWP